MVFYFLLYQSISNKELDFINIGYKINFNLLGQSFRFQRRTVGGILVMDCAGAADCEEDNFHFMRGRGFSQLLIQNYYRHIGI